VSPLDFFEARYRQIRCPDCDAPPFERCRNFPSGEYLDNSHIGRRDAADMAAGPDPWR